MLRELQTAMARAVVAGEPAAALALAGGGDRAAARLAIHRATFRHSLASVLAAAFPAVARSLGPDTFARAAGAFSDAHPPTEARLLAWGDAFPGFLARSVELLDRPWLADLARLERARGEAMFAADAVPLAAADLAAVPVERYETLTFTLLPSARLVASVFPVATLWEAAMAEPPATTVPDAPGEGVLVWRPADAVTHRVVSAGDRALLGALAGGAPLAAAAEAAFAAEPGFDLMTALAAHLAGGTFARAPETDR
ncbi:MAG: putative DNA-binding domain-containing protein [Alphaproteobacteria bacterium]